MLSKEDGINIDKKYVFVGRELKTEQAFEQSC